MFKNIAVALGLTLSSCAGTAPVTAAPMDKCTSGANLLMAVADSREISLPSNALKALIVMGLDEKSALGIVYLVYVQESKSTPEEIGLKYLKHCLSEPA